MKNLTHLIRIQEKIWVNPAHIVKIQILETTTGQELCIFLAADRGAVQATGDYAKNLLASLQTDT